jgi:DNA-binding transcriptional MerR regulator
MIRAMNYTIGELAKHSGVSTRSLRHYDKLGLVIPSGRTPAGYRVYTERDVIALHRVIAYQQMGVPLKEIGPLVAEGAAGLEEVLQRQIVATERELMRQQRLLALLQRAQRRLGSGETGIADDLLKLIGFMRTYERYFNDEELKKMVALQTSMSDDQVRRLRASFREVVQCFQAAMAAGMAANDRAVLVHARRLLALGDGFPDDPVMREKGRKMLADSPAFQRESGVTPELLDYMDAAVAVVRQEATQ